ncbi:MAG: Uma2 family endonuclease [Acidobacteria bacterium]|nr:Uma2 family endonuclease [Acidobacteriota bacterium]
MPSAALALPPILREGDRLNSEEFLRRWEAMPELKRAELIAGVVFMPSPVSRIHSNVHIRLSTWLGTYMDTTPGCEGGVEGTWMMTNESVPQPDVALRILPDFGGQSQDFGTYSAGAPELVLEVSGSSTSRDLGAKLLLYQSVGVREYLTILLDPRQVIWRQLVRGKYRDIKPDADGLLRSRIFPGLWLDPDAVWDPQKSLRTALEKGLASPEHDAFIRKLQSRRRR